MPAQCPYNTSESVCTYTTCPIDQSQCGSQCYRESDQVRNGSSMKANKYFINSQVCCDGIAFNRTAGFGCCNQNYIIQSAADDVCCGGRFYTAQDNYVCCNGQYILVLPGFVCCSTDGGDITTGMGDACCGGTPYNSNDNNTCCGGMLYSYHSTRTCCGNEMISTLTTECCNGVAHLQENGHSCCGSQYIETDTTLCCTGSNGISQVRSTVFKDYKIHKIMCRYFIIQAETKRFQQTNSVVNLTRYQHLLNVVMA